MAEEVRLTTIDNPFDPFDDFTNWLMFDTDHGYNSCAYLARIIKLSDSMSDEEVKEENERAIDEIIQYDVFNLYKKVKKKKE